MNPHFLYKQSNTTAHDMLECATTFLTHESDHEATFENAMRLAELAAYDFRTMMEYSKGESDD